MTVVAAIHAVQLAECEMPGKKKWGEFPKSMGELSLKALIRPSMQINYDALGQAQTLCFDIQTDRFLSVVCLLGQLVDMFTGRILGQACLTQK
ncbi:hypothetical protein NQZ68_029424 [Dissostichus eleginoides]|nr:hypothetical protein NQZ68_029424 [Dissostichus eleginoides]